MIIEDIPTSKLFVSSLNVRKILETDENLNELASNIQNNGLLNPLTVKYNKKSDKYEIVAGQRRFLACKKLSIPKIKCTILNNDISEKDQIKISLIENVQREQMKISEKVKAYKKLYKSLYVNSKEETMELVAKQVNVSLPTIKKYLEITHLPDIILDKLDASNTEKISLDFATKLAKTTITDEEELVQIVNKFNNISAKARLPILKSLIDSMDDIDASDIKNFIKAIEEQEKNYYAKILEKEQVKRDNDTFNKMKDEFKNKQNEIIKEKDDIIKNLKKKIRELEKQLPDLIDDTSSDKSDIKKESDAKLNYNETITEQKNISRPLYVNCLQRNPELQSEYRAKLIERYKNCIISNLHPNLCEACHIIPFSECENFDIENGLLLNPILHKLFDSHQFSIEPKTLIVKVNRNSIYYSYMKQFKNKKISILEQFTSVINNLETHYKIYLSYKK
jgi:ParB family chromosome partitioning protein